LLDASRQAQWLPRADPGPALAERNVSIAERLLWTG
jgi:hypothetical protein